MIFNNWGFGVFQKLERRLSGQIQANVRDEPDILLEALSELAQPENLREILSCIATDQTTAARVAADSYLHENGFLKLTLVTTPDFQLRLHVWDTREGGLPYLPEDIHSHTADFASVILLGGYQHEIFLETETGNEYHGYAYDGVRGSKIFSLEYAGLQCLRCVSNSYLPTRTAYNLNSEILHRVIPKPGCLTSSLVLKGPANNPAVRVYSNSTLSAGTEIAVRPLPDGSLLR